MKPAARIATTTPLRRAGLERALTRAGLAIAPPERETLIAIRSSDDPPTDSPIELSVSHDAVHLTIRCAIDARSWQSLGRLTEELMNDSRGRTSDTRDTPL